MENKILFLLKMNMPTCHYQKQSTILQSMCEASQTWKYWNILFFECTAVVCYLPIFAVGSFLQNKDSIYIQNRFTCIEETSSINVK